MSVKNKISNKPVYLIHVIMPRIGDKPDELHLSNLTYSVYRSCIRTLLSYNPRGMVNYSAHALRVVMPVGEYQDMVDKLYNQCCNLKRG